MKRLLLALSLVIAAPVMAQHLGVHGNLWEIQEEDAVGFIKRRAAELDKDGTIDKMRKENTAKITDAIINQKPVDGISSAKMDRIRYFDPSITTDKAITDSSGRVLFPAGTRVNPLIYGGLSKRLIFIDARDPIQVEFAIQEAKKDSRDSIILVAGSWVDVSKKIGSQAYYDQAGEMVRRFGLTVVPSIVSQAGLKLKIEEFYPGAAR